MTSVKARAFQGYIEAILFLVLRGEPAVKRAPGDSEYRSRTVCRRAPAKLKPKGTGGFALIPAQSAFGNMPDMSLVALLGLITNPLRQNGSI